MALLDDAPREHFETADEWRRWLEAHHASSSGIFVVYWRKATGRPAMSYDEMVEQALCFGWVDSRPGKLDDERSMLWFTPRKRGSAWAGPNKERVDRLTAAGLMHPAGIAVVDAAKADGTWTLLDAVERLEVPDDLAARLAAVDGARAQWDSFPRSVRRGILEWIVHAKTPATRERRIQETADRAGRGERANQWSPKS